MDKHKAQGNKWQRAFRARAPAPINITFLLAFGKTRDASRKG